MDSFYVLIVIAALAFLVLSPVFAAIAARRVGRMERRLRSEKQKLLWSHSAREPNLRLPVLPHLSRLKARYPPRLPDLGPYASTEFFV